MYQVDLNGTWRMIGAGYDCTGTVPGSVYSFLLDNKLIDDPYYRENEWEAEKIMDHDFQFIRTFSFTPTGDKVLLHCDGLDTLCDIYLNDVFVESTNNMHRTYEFDVTELLKNGENVITIIFHPLREYMLEMHKKHPLSPSRDTAAGFGHVRKTYCMYGWDWGPRLPDAGIWKDISLIVLDSARIADFQILQRHESGKVYVTPIVKTDAAACTCDDALQLLITCTASDGTTFTLETNQETEIQNPQLWWPNGLGEQSLYTFTASLLQKDNCYCRASSEALDRQTIIVDSQSKRIGLRTLKLIREKDKYGEGFCHEVNGVRFFAMGADYIPEDNIFSRITPDRTRWLLKQCQDSHFNAIRVWGGGFYPHDFFFDICDELGLVVFEDMMVACTMLWLEGDFKENLRSEFTDNLKRMRHHACLALISGNNELEHCFGPYSSVWKMNDEKQLKQMYYDIFEDMLPRLVKELCPDMGYISTSPITCGHFIDPANENYGDCHYWDVWHGNLPFTEYRNHYFRYLSEFGFQSFPCEKTVNAFTIPEDRNIFSRVMEMHQRNGSANGKIMNYLAQTFRYPTEFGTLLYASQLLQAEAIRYGVEHLRRHRGRCMGALYWQLNDIWPVASWASIDYYGRYKALQYVAKRFYSPVIISCKETGEKDTRPIVTWEKPLYDYETKAQLCVTNDTLEPVNGTVFWALRDSSGTILRKGQTEITVPALSVVRLEEMDFNKTDVDNTYISYALMVNGYMISEGTALFTAPKYFRFPDPKLRYEINGDEITVYADTYAKYVEVDSPDSDFILSDNYFDMNGGSKTVKIVEGAPKSIRLRSAYDIK